MRFIESGQVGHLVVPVAIESRKTVNTPGTDLPCSKDAEAWPQRRLRANMRRPMNPVTQPVTVALVEDDSRVRERFERAIATEPSLRCLFAASTAHELLEW